MGDCEAVNSGKPARLQACVWLSTDCVLCACSFPQGDAASLRVSQTDTFTGNIQDNRRFAPATHAFKDFAMIPE